MKNKAAIHEPMPISGTGEKVLDQVRQDLTDRDTVGRQKYGQSLKTFTGRDALMDAYQEALDLVMYLRQVIMERDDRVYNNTRPDKIEEE